MTYSTSKKQNQSSAERKRQKLHQAFVKRTTMMSNVMILRQLLPIQPYLRGGSSYHNHPDGYDWVRQEQLEQLHEQMQPPHYYPPHHNNYPYQYTDNPYYPQQQRCV